MKLTKREMVFIYAGVAFIIIMGGYLLTKYLVKQMSVDDELQAVLSERSQVESLGKRYRQLLSIAKPGSTGGPTIDQYIEGLIAQAGLADKATIRPTENVVQNKFKKRTINITFNKIDAMPVLTLLNRIETEKGDSYKVEYFSSRKTGKDPGFYVFNLKVSSYEKKGS